MDFRQSNENQPKSLLGKIRSRGSLAFGSNVNSIDELDSGANSNPHRIVWQLNKELKIYNGEDVLHIQCFDANPYAPHQLLGEAKITVREMLHAREFYKVSSPRELLEKNLPLEIPSEQLSRNFCHKLNIKPYLKIRFDLAINTDRQSIARLYGIKQSTKLATDF